MRQKSSWQKRLGDGSIQIKPIPERMRLNQNRMPGDTIAIPTAMAVQPIISAIPRGKVTTAALLARIIATKSNATLGCSVTTGICAWIIANAAHDEPHSFADVVPWWRVVKPRGELNAQYPGGVLRQKALLEEENVAFFHRRGRSFVHRDYVIADSPKKGDDIVLFPF